MADCCRSGFRWQGDTSGTVTKLGDHDIYITGDNGSRAILLCHDGYGWEFLNNRLLADHWAREIGATVYLPDFFHGTAVPEAALDKNENGDYKMKFDWAAWIKTNDASVRMPEVLSVADALRAKHPQLAAVGHCWGGKIAALLGSTSHAGLVHAVSMAHPSFLTKEDISAVIVPIQILAPEHDPVYTQELKDYSKSELTRNGIEHSYHYFPGMSHGFATRCDVSNEEQKKALERAKNAVVYWFSNYLA